MLQRVSPDACPWVLPGDTEPGCRPPYSLEDAPEPLFAGSLSLQLWSLVLGMTLMPPSTCLSGVTLLCLAVKVVLGSSRCRGACAGTAGSVPQVGLCPLHECTLAALHIPGGHFIYTAPGSSSSCPSLHILRALLSLAWPWWPPQPPCMGMGVRQGTRGIPPTLIPVIWWLS